MLKLLMDLSIFWFHNIISSAWKEEMTNKTKEVQYLSVNLKLFFLTTYSHLYLPCTYAGFFSPLCCSYFKVWPWTNLRSVGGFSEIMMGHWIDKLLKFTWKILLTSTGCRNEPLAMLNERCLLSLERYYLVKDYLRSRHLTTHSFWNSKI